MSPRNSRYGCGKASSCCGSGAMLDMRWSVYGGARGTGPSRRTGGSEAVVELDAEHARLDRHCADLHNRAGQRAGGRADRRPGALVDQSVDVGEKRPGPLADPGGQVERAEGIGLDWMQGVRG